MAKEIVPDARHSPQTNFYFFAKNGVYGDVRLAIEMGRISGVEYLSPDTNCRYPEIMKS